MQYLQEKYSIYATSIQSKVINVVYYNYAVKNAVTYAINFAVKMQPAMQSIIQAAAQLIMHLTTQSAPFADVWMKWTFTFWLAEDTNIYFFEVICKSLRDARGIRVVYGRQKLKAFG